MAQMTALCVETQILVTSDQKEIMNNCTQNVKLQKYLIIFLSFFKKKNFKKKFIYLFIYLFMAVLGLRFCVRAFSSCGKRGPLCIAVHRPLTAAASLVAEHRLQTRRLSSCGARA